MAVPPNLPANHQNNVSEAIDALFVNDLATAANIAIYTNATPQVKTGTLQAPIILPNGTRLWDFTGVPPNASGVNGDIAFRNDGNGILTIYQMVANAWLQVGTPTTGTAGGILTGTYPSPTFGLPVWLAKTANYTVVAADAFGMLTADPTLGAITITLPAANSVGAGWIGPLIKRISSSASLVTIVPFSGSDTIEGLVSWVLSSQWDAMQPRSNGVNTWLATAVVRTEPYSAKTAAYTVVLADRGGLITADATTAAFPVTLPAANSVIAGWVGPTIKRINGGTNAVVVTAAGSDIIDSQNTYSLDQQFSGITPRSNGSNRWWVS